MYRIHAGNNSALWLLSLQGYENQFISLQTVSQSRSLQTVSNGELQVPDSFELLTPLV
jgi:hypothetical protein